MQITPEDFQRYLRIILQWVAGALVSYGFVNKDATWIAPAIGMAMTAGSFLWTLYGNRVQAKINEVAAMGNDPSSPVKGVLIEQNAAGRALSASAFNANPDAAVALAGTHAAAQMASATPTVTVGATK